MSLPFPELGKSKKSICVSGNNQGKIMINTESLPELDSILEENNSIERQWRTFFVCIHLSQDHSNLSTTKKTTSSVCFNGMQRAKNPSTKSLLSYIPKITMKGIDIDIIEYPHLKRLNYMLTLVKQQ